MTLVMMKSIRSKTAANNNSVKNGFLRYPRLDTYKIITATAQVFNLFRINEKLNTRNAFHKMILNTLEDVNTSTLFTNFDTHAREFMEILGIMENHKFILMKLILQLFFKIKLYLYGKHIT